MDEKELGTFTLASRTKLHQGEQYQQSFEAPNARILVVDDNDMNLMVVRKLLSATKIQLDMARSGAECLKLTQNQHYDAILMDHLMPEMDGIQCLHELRSQPGGPCQDVPVIALTANAGSDNQLLYRKEGFSGYLAKPVSGALLEASVLSVLPKELVTLSENAAQSEIGKDVLIFEQAKRIPLLVTTDSVCDLPETLLREFNIAVCSYYVCTERGRFLDEVEIQSDELLMHMAAGWDGRSQPPEVEDYERFFAGKLTEAQNVLHIAMAKHASEGYNNALEAARSFENVTVIDSGHLSSMMCRAGQISKRTQILCDALLLHPIIVMKKSRMTVGGMLWGDFQHVARRYVRRVLMDSRNIDRRVLFITYAGMDEKSLQYIQDLVLQYCPFERIYLQKASSAIACNCGKRSFGLLFMKKTDAVISFSQVSRQKDLEMDF